MGDDHPERRRAAGPARRVRADVGRRLQPRQSVADGAHDFGRLCRRRRDRDARKHHPLRRRRRRSACGRVERLSRNRLHHCIHQRFADCGVDSALADGRHRRTAVPGIRGHAVDDDRRVGRSVAHVDANDGLAFPGLCEGHAPRAPLRPERARFCGVAKGLRALPRRRAQIPFGYAGSFLRVPRPVRLSFRSNPQGVLSAAGYRPDQRRFRGGARRLLRRNGEASGGAWRDRPQGSGGRSCRDVHWRDGQRAQRRPDVHNTQAARPAHSDGGSDYRPVGPATRQSRGREIVHAVAQDLTVGGRASRTQYQYTLQGSDPDALNTWAPRMLAKLQTLPELRDVATDQQAAGTTLTLTFDRDQASRYGLTAQTIDDTLFDAFGQRQIAQYFTQLSSYEVIMEILPSMQNDLTTLDRIFLKSPTTGGEVPLSVFAQWTTTPIQPLSISHQGQFPAVTISFNLAPGVALGQATGVIQRAQEELQLPATVVPSFQGNAQAFQDSLSTVWILIIGALVVVYLILGILYESYIHPITIISTLPSAGVGALATLMLFHFDFSLIALIGIILLIGIVKKNGIMLVDFALVAERDDHLSAYDAVRRAALLRFRPIMMTTMAAMLGGVPLMLGTGTGSELRQPLGYAIVGGLLISQALTLFTTPVIYIYLDQLSDWVSSWRRSAAPKQELPTAPNAA